MFTVQPFAVTIFGALAVNAVIVLRYRRPELARPFKAPFYPLMPIAFVRDLDLDRGLHLRGTPVEVRLGLATIAAGLPIYFAPGIAHTIMRRKMRVTASD